MKKGFTLVLLVCCAVLQVSAQTITSFTISPANPTTADLITIYIRCDFQNGNCEGETFNDGINGNILSGGGLHCMGSFPVLCTDYDTLVYPPLPAGQYDVYYMLTTGTTAACLFGIIPLDFDSTQFTVTVASGVEDMNDFHAVISGPNPSGNEFTVEQYEGDGVILKIYTSDGRLQEQYPLSNGKTHISSGLTSGIYFVVMESKKGRVVLRHAIVN